MLGVIFFPEVADYDSLAGTGMYKFAVLEVDTYVCHFFAGSTAGEEHQISLTQVAAGDFAAAAERRAAGGGDCRQAVHDRRRRVLSSLLYEAGGADTGAAGEELHLL